MLCGHGRAGQTQLLLFLRRILRSKIRNSAAAKARAGRASNQIRLNFQNVFVGRDEVTVFELNPVIDFIKQNKRLQTLEADFRDYDMLTKNTVEARMDFIL